MGLIHIWSTCELGPIMARYDFLRVILSNLESTFIFG